MAAEQGNAMAQINLGQKYDAGKGVPQDDAEAAKWYQLAAKQGDAMAQLLLGFRYEQGKGVPQDGAEAHIWYNLSAGNGVPEAAVSRDDLGKQMSPADLSEAQRRARVCLASNYKDCN